MKKSKLHSDAKKSLDYIAEKSIGIIAKDKRKLEKTLKWIKVQNKFLKNLADLTKDLPTSDKKMHHYIEENIYQTLSLTKDSILNIGKTISDKNIDEVSRYIHDCNTQIDTAKDVIEIVSSQLEDFLDELETGIYKGLPRNYAESVKRRVKTHTLYLQYMKSIHDNEVKYLQESFYQKLIKLDEQIVNSINLIWSNLNQSAIRNYHSSGSFRSPQLYPNNKDTLTKHSLSAQSYHNCYYSPVFNLKPIITFSDATVKMKATQNFDGDKVGELKLELNEVVDVINSSYADWYKVRNSKGVEGFVPVSCLIPYKK